MTSNEFTELVNILNEHRMPLMNNKGTEYGANDDRMWNFKFCSAVMSLWLEAKQGNDVSQAEAAFLLSLKHLASIVKILASDEPTSIEMLKEKYGDLQNYNDIQFALLVEQK